MFRIIATGLTVFTGSLNLYAQENSSQKIKKSDSTRTLLGAWNVDSALAQTNTTIEKETGDLDCSLQFKQDDVAPAIKDQLQKNGFTKLSDGKTARFSFGYRLVRKIYSGDQVASAMSTLDMNSSLVVPNDLQYMMSSEIDLVFSATYEVNEEISRASEDQFMRKYVGAEEAIIEVLSQLPRCKGGVLEH